MDLWIPKRIHALTKKTMVGLYQFHKQLVTHDPGSQTPATPWVLRCRHFKVITCGVEAYERLPIQTSARLSARQGKDPDGCMAPN